MSGFHTAALCVDCDPPVVAISTGYGSRCPRCGQVEEWPPRTTDAIDTRLDGALARQVLADTAIRSDGDARLLAELAGRLLDRAGKQPSVPPSESVPPREHRQPDLSDWDQAEVAKEIAPWPKRDHEHLRRLYADSRDYVATLERERDDLVIANRQRTGEVNQLDARVDQLEIALSEALAEWESSEYRGRRAHLPRLSQLRAVLAGKAPQS